MKAVQALTATAVGMVAANGVAAISITGSGATFSVTAGSAAGKWIVTINATTPQTSSVPRLTLSATASDVIELLQINNPMGVNTHVELKIGGGLVKDPLAGIEAIVITNPATTRFGFHDLKFEGDLGTPGSGSMMMVNWANYIQVGGDWYTNFVIDGSQPADQRSLVIDGDVLEGGIYNNVGKFEDIQVKGVINGPTLDPIEIWAKTSIEFVRADDMSEVRIGSQTAGFSGYTDVGFIQVLAGGDFVSSAPMTMDALGYLNIGGDFDADVTVNSALSSTQASQIQGDFEAAAILSLPTNGLPGNFIINAAGTTGQFLGDIEVGATILNANYTTLSKNLGAGAAGAAPFNFHQFTGPAPASRADLDCNPWHTEFIVVGDCEEVTSLNAAVIDHYGPVYADGSDPHYRIEFRPAFTAPGNPTWYDVSAQFEVDTAATATSSTSTNRAVRIIPVPTNSNGFEAAGTFRFRPLDGKIKCAGVTGNPDVAYDSSIVSGDLGNTTSGTQHHWYQFRVGLSPCPGGSPLFENDRVNPSDIAAWMNEPFEVNMDGQICQQDLADLLAAYDAQ